MLAAHKKEINERIFYYRVDIELINEQVKLFYSNLDQVTIAYDDDHFKTVEYVKLGLGSKKKFYPLEELILTFKNNGTYTIDNKLIFEPPQYDRKALLHIMNANKNILSKLQGGQSLSVREEVDLGYVPDTYLLCYLNGFEAARKAMEQAKPLLRDGYPELYEQLKYALRVIRKVRYS